MRSDKCLTKTDRQESGPTLKVVASAIHLMRTGNVEADLRLLNEEFKLDYLPDLITRRLEGPEKSVLGKACEPGSEAKGFIFLVRRSPSAGVRL